MVVHKAVHSVCTSSFLLVSSPVITITKLKRKYIIPHNLKDKSRGQPSPPLGYYWIAHDVHSRSPTHAFNASLLNTKGVRDPYINVPFCYALLVVIQTVNLWSHPATCQVVIRSHQVYARLNQLSWVWFRAIVNTSDNFSFPWPFTLAVGPPVSPWQILSF